MSSTLTSTAMTYEKDEVVLEICSDIVKGNTNAIDKLQCYNCNVQFYGFGFIKVILDSYRIFHFYHEDLDNLIENPHNNQYNFILSVLRGHLKTTVWEECESDNPNKYPIEISYNSFSKDNLVQIPDSYPAFITEVGKFDTKEGSSHYINRNTFYRNNAEFSAGPCITFLERGIIQNNFFKILQMDYEKCYISKMNQDKIWDIIEKCIKK